MPAGRLLWDEENEEHVARHRVTSEEVDVAFRSTPFLHRTREGKYEVIGRTTGGRYLTIIVAPLPYGDWYVVTARDADQSERRRFR